jgi:glycerol-3-phosphate dehydrogenase (NAD(P)+)
MPRTRPANYRLAVARVTVFGAGAMGTAFAIHSRRAGLETALWAHPLDRQALDSIRDTGSHPALTERLPEGLRVFDPDDAEEAARGCTVAVMAANSHGARSMARTVAPLIGSAEIVLSVAKGLEAGSGKRMSEVYAEEIGGAQTISIGGPCLASELAEAIPTAAVWAAGSIQIARSAAEPFETPGYQVVCTDDVIGVEMCSMMKNVAAIGLGLLDGLGKATGRDFKNAKSALFTKAAHELSELITALGGKPETALGLAGIGDQLVTSLGGRNRLFGELVGAGEPPDTTLKSLEARGLTVEGVDSTKDVRRLADERGLDLPYHRAVHRVLFEGAHPRDLMEVLR